MTHIYLAIGGREQCLESWDWSNEPINLLVAFPYMRGFLRMRYKPARSMLDSGAFSAWQSGIEVDLAALVRETKNPRWTESVGLDVIGSWEGSKTNAIKQKVLGSPAMPVFHIGDPWDLLDFYCAHWPKVGLSCRFGEPIPESMEFYKTCFARAWPHRFHSFGWTDARALMQYPFHSADSSTWKTVDMYGNIIAKSGSVLHPTRQWTIPNVPSPVKQRYRALHVRRYRELERMLKWKWRAELAELGDWP